MGNKSKNTVDTMQAQQGTLAPELAKVKVLQPFRDKFDVKVRYEAGAELEFEPERAADLVSRELAEYIDPLG